MAKQAKKETKMGAPTKYKKEYDEQVYKLCLLGATDIKIADFLGVDEQTITNWKHKHPDFFGSIKAGKEEADAKVADSLYNRALGYTHKETKVFNHGGEIITHEVDKHYPPDAASAIFWLKNRQKTNWRDKQEHELSGDVGITFDLNYGLQKDLGITRDEDE